MKLPALPVLALFLLLTACGAEPSVGSAPGAAVSAENVAEASMEESAESMTGASAGESAANVTPRVDEVDFAAFQTELSVEDWAALQSYLPILEDGGSFQWTQSGWWENPKTLTATLAGYHEEMQRLLGSNPAEVPRALDNFSLTDLDGDGAAELILNLPNDCGYLILHQEGDKLYGTGRALRGFRYLQKNGIFAATGGAGFDTFYYKMSIENGVFSETELAHRQMLADSDGAAEYVIAGQAVAKTQLDDWKEEQLIGDAVWYAAGSHLIETMQ